MSSLLQITRYPVSSLAVESEQAQGVSLYFLFLIPKHSGGLNGRE